MRRRKNRGFSLIELMCVSTIILILIGMMLGPITRAYRKAKNFGWENDSYQLRHRFVDRLQKHFGSASTYPALTADQLFEAGVIDSTILNFLRDKRVRYSPFSSQMPEEFIILHVQVEKSAALILRKGDLTPPKE